MFPKNTFNKSRTDVMCIGKPEKYTSKTVLTIKLANIRGNKLF